MARNTFWDKVSVCDHEWCDDYLELMGTCATPYCGAIYEKKCKKCGVYQISCACQTSFELSGWSHKRHNAVTQRQQEYEKDMREDWETCHQNSWAYEGL